MRMRFIQVTTHWEAEEALAVIAFLDTVRDALYSNHGEQIERMRRGDGQERRAGEEQMDFAFDDPLPF